MAVQLSGSPDWYLNSSGGTNQYNVPVTRAAGEGLLVCIYSEADYSPTSAPTSVTWDTSGDNQPMTLIKRQQLASDNRYISLWWLASPTSAKTSLITINYPDSYLSRVGVMTRHIVGHDATAAITFASYSGGFGNTSGSANYPLTESISSAVGNLTVDFFAWRNDVSTLTAGAGQGSVSIKSVLAGSRVLGSSSLAGAATDSFTWQTNDAQYGYAHIIASIPAGAAPPNNPPTFNGTIANITGVGGTPISSVDVHSAFSDTDTLTYSASPAGTAWPSGLTINSSTGVISGTVATSTTTGLKVRATDTANQTVDSNAFSVTISAPASTVTSVTVVPSTATVNGGASQTFSASVAGTNSPSQLVNWSASAGSINTSGVFTAPATTSSVQNITITAYSAQDNTKSGTATVTVPAATTATSYVDMGTDACDNIQSGLMPSTALTAVVINRSDLTVAKQVITGITTTAGSLVPRFATTFAVGTPVHVVLINAADNTVTGIVSDHVTVA